MANVDSLTDVKAAYPSGGSLYIPVISQMILTVLPALCWIILYHARIHPSVSGWECIGLPSIKHVIDAYDNQRIANGLVELLKSLVHDGASFSTNPPTLREEQSSTSPSPCSQRAKGGQIGSPSPFGRGI